MENEFEKPSLFNLAVDEDMKFNLKEIAKWAKFLGVIGFIGLGLMILAGLAMMTAIPRLGSGMDLGMGVGMFFLYLVIGALYFYPVFSIFKFGKGMKVGILNNDQLQINTALRSLKNCFQYMGIVTIIMLCMYGLFAIIGLIALAVKF